VRAFAAAAFVEPTRMNVKAGLDAAFGEDLADIISEALLCWVSYVTQETRTLTFFALRDRVQPAADDRYVKLAVPITEEMILMMLNMRGEVDVVPPIEPSSGKGLH